MKRLLGKSIAVCLLMIGNPGISYGDAEPQVSLQLQQILSEIKSLKAELAQVRQAVTEMHRAAILPTKTAEPAPVLVKSVEFDNDPSLGSEKATIGMVEFSDYECPFCRRFHAQVFPKLKQNYIDTGKVKYVFRDAPLDFHAEAKSAAIAANCAGMKGKYWEFNNAFMQGSVQLNRGFYIEQAGKSSLELDVFEKCLKDQGQAQEVERDIAYAQSIGVSGTPTFFVGRIQGDKLVNAKRVVGAQSYEVIAKAIEAIGSDK